MSFFKGLELGEVWTKIKWQLVSFKFIGFWTFVLLLIAAWNSLEHLQDKSISIAKELYALGYVTKDGVTTIVTHSQTVLYDSALGHLLIFFAAILGSIIAIKGVTYWTNSQQTKEVIRKLNGDTTKEDLKKFLPKSGQ